MKVKLKKHGANSQALVIPKAIIELFKVNKDTEFEIKPGTNSFTIEMSIGSPNIAQTMEEIDKTRAPLFKSLANK